MVLELSLISFFIFGKSAKIKRILFETKLTGFEKKYGKDKKESSCAIVKRYCTMYNTIIWKLNNIGK